jgi:hypothetical protein
VLADIFLQKAEMINYSDNSRFYVLHPEILVLLLVFAKLNTLYGDVRLTLWKIYLLGYAQTLAHM